MKIFLMAGSLRRESLNKKLLSVAENILAERGGHELLRVDLQGLGIPVYDGDIEAQGIPESIQTLGRRAAACSAWVIATPEYNGSISGALKNTIDWMSRLRPHPFEKKAVLLLGASPGGFGALRGLVATRAPFEQLNSFVYPQVYALPKAHEAFDEQGLLKEAGAKNRLEGLLTQFEEFAQAFT